MLGSCRISPPYFLAKCHKRQLNCGILFCFLGVVISVEFCMFLCYLVLSGLIRSLLWLGGVVVRVLDLQLEIAGSIPAASLSSGTLDKLFAHIVQCL